MGLTLRDRGEVPEQTALTVSSLTGEETLSHAPRVTEWPSVPRGGCLVEAGGWRLTRWPWAGASCSAVRADIGVLADIGTNTLFRVFFCLFPKWRRLRIPAIASEDKSPQFLTNSPHPHRRNSSDSTHTACLPLCVCVSLHLSVCRCTHAHNPHIHTHTCSHSHTHLILQAPIRKDLLSFSHFWRRLYDPVDLLFVGA